MSEQTIAAQVHEFNPGFIEAVGPQNAAAFDEEQEALTEAGVPEGAVRAGDRLPDATLLTADGEETTLAAATGGRTAVIVFYRGVWCPYCSITLRSYQRNLVPALAGRDVALIAVSPQTPESTGRTTEEWKLDFTALSDPGNALAGALGIVTEPSAAAQDAHARIGFDVADSNADATRRIPFPTLLVVDGNGVVRYADVHVDYTTRTETADVLAALDRL